MSDATVSLTLHDLSADQVTAIMAIVTGDASAAKPASKAAPKKTTKPAAKPKEEKPVESDEGGTPADLTADVVRNALKAYRSKHSKEDAEKIIAATGAPNITSIEEDKYPLVMELCEKDPADLPSDDGEDWD